MSLSSLGVGSGLDIGGLVDQLVAAERQPVERRLARREIEATTELTSFSRVSGAISGLDSALEALDEADDFDLRRTQNSNGEALGVTTGSGAPLGSYDVVIERLAQRHRLGSAEYAEGASFGGGVDDGLAFTVGEATFSVDLSTATDLAGVRDAIVEAAGGALSASLVTTDDGARALVLNASDSGEANAIQIAFEGTLDANSFGFQTLNTDAAGATIGSLAELDARIVVDGFAATRADNRITDVLEGVTLDLRAADPGETIEVSVSRDLGGLANRLGEVVKRYNALTETIADVTAFDADTGERGALIGDVTIRSLQSRVREALGVGTRETIELGISSDENGRLSFDSGTFISRLNEDETGTIAILSGADGLVTRLRAQAEAYGGEDGLIGARTEGLDARLESLEGEREGLQVRLEILERRLISQFTALDTLVAQFNTTGSFLSQQLDNLPGFTRPGND